VLRVTADSNIYISAMNFGGAPDKLLDMARNGDLVLAISDPIVEEVTHVLRDKFGWTREAHHLLRDNPVHLNITSFGFTKPSESKDPSRRFVYFLRSPGGQFLRINSNGVF
jgi:hypothetical protein